MIKFIHILFLLFSISLSASAQEFKIDGYDGIVKNSKKTSLGTSFMECVYEHLTYDSACDETKIDDEILQIGKNASLYSFYGTYQRDSIVAADYPEGIRFQEYCKLSNKYNGRLDELLKDLSNNKIYFNKRILVDKYEYEEPIPEIKWSFSKGTETICGYTCKKATTTFRGRNWTAWYCPEIQIDNGPWKFNGLPGLILKVEDDKKEHIFEAMQIRKSNREFGYRKSKSRIKIDRKSFNKLLHDYKTDAATFFAGNPNMPTKIDGSPALSHNRSFYNPIEKD